MKLEDGTLTLHQSDIKTYMKCPEQFRLSAILADDHPDKVARVETDAAMVGTTVHHVIYQDLAHNRASTLEAGVNMAGKFWWESQAQFRRDGVEFRQESFGTDAKALDAVNWLLARWYASQERRYWKSNPTLKPEHLEFDFDVPFLSGIDGPIHTVRLAGSADVIDQYGNAVEDWKTSSRKYERWEHQRWDPQPTVYTYAAATLGLLTPNEDGYYKFTFKVFIHKESGEPQSVTVFRGPNQWAWLTELCHNIVEQFDRIDRRWPLRDDHALCGPKWCPAWSQCKGRFVDADNWY